MPVAARSLGRWGEARLANFLGGKGTKPSSPFHTSLGPRFVDRLLDGIAYESKAGVNVQLTQTIRTQIAKDAELIKSRQIRGAEWHFWQGASPELTKALQDAGIKAVDHSRASDFPKVK